MKPAIKARPLSVQEYDWLQRFRTAVDRHWVGLTEFEKRFCGDLLARFEQFGIRTFVSRKQWEIVAEIGEKVM